MKLENAGMVKNTSVRARSFASQNDDALRKMLAFSLVLAPRAFPFKGVGNSREKVRFRLVKAHQQKSTGTILCFFAVFPSATHLDGAVRLMWKTALKFKRLSRAAR